MLDFLLYSLSYGSSHNSEILQVLIFLISLDLLSLIRNPGVTGHGHLEDYTIVDVAEQLEVPEPSETLGTRVEVLAVTQPSACLRSRTDPQLHPEGSAIVL